MAILQEMEQAMERAGDATWLALWKYQVRLAEGETTGDRLKDYLAFDSRGHGDFRKREEKIRAMLERLSKAIGQEMLVGYQQTDYTSHTWPGTFTGAHKFWNFGLTKIKTGDFEVKMEVIREREMGKLAKAELLLPVDGYSQLSHGFGIHSWREPEPFVVGPVTFPEYADVLAIGRQEVSEWRKHSKSNEGDYRALKRQLNKGLAAMPAA